MAYAYCNKHNVSWDDENHEDCLECIEQIALKEQPKTAQFTPGPWVVTEHSAGMICVAGPDHKDLCAVGYNRTEGRNDVANAALIAAAPAMYEAGKPFIEASNLFEVIDDGGGDRYVLTVTKAEYAALRAALAQAEGRG